MCGSSGMISQDEELTAILHTHQNTVDSYLGGVVASSTASASSSLEAAYREPLQLPYSSDCSMLGPGGSSLAYSDQAGGKPLMSLQTLNLPTQDNQGGPQLAPCSPMLSKNGARRPGVWGATSPNGLQKDWINGRSGMMEMDCRNLPTDYSSALLDQVPAQITDPYRVPGGLARYHSAPSSLLQSLADFQQEVVSRPMSQLDNSLSSFFSDAELPPLSQSNDAGLEQMETEHSANSMYSMMNTRKFDNRLGKPGALYDQLGSVNGPTKPPMMQSVYKPSMDVLHENVTGSTQMTPQMNSQINSQLNSQIPSSSQMASSIGLSSTMGLLGQQDNTHAGQQMGLGNLAQSMGNDFSGNFTGSSGTLAGLTSSRLSHKGSNNTSLLRQSSSPAGLLAQLSIDVQAMAGTAKSEKQSLSSPIAHSPTESLSGGTSEENGGAGTGPGTPGMMSRMDVGAWEDAQSYMNSWDSTNFAARKRFRDMEIDPLGDSFMPDPLRSSQDHNPAPLTRHMSLPTQKSKNSVLTDDILQSVPCRIRAKRGCATHPRSIAERVRRTRISERMRKLQELVPNMDKQQTNTADMLDEAVEYVKQLQRQVQELTESKCKGNCREHKDNNLSS